MSAREIVEYIENGNIVNSVNMPNASVPRSGLPRICIIHKNIPNIIAQVTSAVSACGINIENMVNASKKGKDYAYTILEVQTLADGLDDTIKALDGIIRVRIIK